MKTFREDDLDGISLIMEVVREKVGLPVARPACWHDRSWIRDASGSRLIDDYRSDKPAQTQPVKRLVGNVLSLLKRYAQPWRHRG